MALSRRAPAPSTADARAAVRRVAGTWQQPEPWTVAVLLVTGIVIIARHPLAHALGTEVDTPPAAPTTVATAPPAAPAAVLPAAAALAPMPTHAPRDPFRALLSSTGKVLAPEAAAAALPATHPAAAHHPAATHHPVSTPTAAGGSCAGSTYRVVAGDTLWTIAANAVRSDKTGRVEVAWRHVYADNKAVIGSDPAMLPVGVNLCLPNAL